MLILRLRQARVALDDGRLEEAFELLRLPAAASHRGGQGLLARLVNALVTRGRQHLEAGRVNAAATDAEKAWQLGGNRVDIVTLRTAVADLLHDQQRRERRRQSMLAAAQGHVEQGRFQLGTALLDGNSMSDCTRAELLRQEIHGRSAVVSAALDAARVALEGGQLHLAVDEICRARSGGAADPDVRASIAQLSESLREQVRAALREGDMLRATDELDRHLQRIDPDHAEVRQLQMICRDLRQIWVAFVEGNFAEARARLGRSMQRLPDAAWLVPLAGQLEAAERASTVLHASPLACFDPAAFPTLPPAHTRKASATSLRTEVGPNAGDGLPACFVINIEGVGSVLVIRSATVTIGPVSATPPPSVGLVADPSLPPMRIERCDDDYFLATRSPAGGRRLLRSGERLELSRRCRFTFRLPSAASTSAVLEFNTGCLARGADCRRVVLMDQDLIIGPGAGAHLPAPLVGAPVVLHLRDGQLMHRAGEPLAIGVNHQVGELSLFVDRA